VSLLYTPSVDNSYTPQALLAHRLSIAAADGAHGAHSARRAAGVDERLAFLEGVVRAAPLPV